MIEPPSKRVVASAGLIITHFARPLIACAALVLCFGCAQTVDPTAGSESDSGVPDQPVTFQELAAPVSSEPLQDKSSADLEKENQQLRSTLGKLENLVGQYGDKLERAKVDVRIKQNAVEEAKRKEEDFHRRHKRAEEILKRLTDDSAQAVKEAGQLAHESEVARWKAFDAAGEQLLGSLSSLYSDKVKSAIQRAGKDHEALARAGNDVLKGLPAGDVERYKKVLDPHLQFLSEYHAALVGIQAFEGVKAQNQVQEALRDKKYGAIEEKIRAANAQVKAWDKQMQSAFDALQAIAAARRDPELLAVLKDSRVASFLSGFEKAASFCKYPEFYFFLKTYTLSAGEFAFDWVGVLRAVERVEENAKAVDAVGQELKRRVDREREEREKRLRAEESLKADKRQLGEAEKRYLQISNRLTEVRARIAEIQRLLRSGSR